MKVVPSKYNVFISHKNRFCVANTMTCAVIELEQDEFYALKENDLSFFAYEQIAEMNNQGIVIDERLDELALLRSAYQCGKNKNEAHLTICPTLECNLACPYCYEKHVQGAMSRETQDNILKLVDYLLKEGVNKIYVLWYGGEPLLYPEIITRVSTLIADKCVDNDCECCFSMISNGVLLDEDILSILKQIPISRIQITLDGEEGIHDKRRYLKDGTPTFNKIVNNIETASKDIKIVVRVNVDHSNKNSYQYIKSLFENKDNISVYCAPVTIENVQSAIIKKRCYTHDDYVDFYKENIPLDDISLRSGIYFCSAEMKYSYVIDPNGYIFKCLNDIGQVGWSIGNVNNTELKTNPMAIAKYLGRDPFTEEECASCVFLPQCSGGCIWNYKDKGTHACKGAKYFFEEKIIKNYLSEEVQQ